MKTGFTIFLLAGLCYTQLLSAQTQTWQWAENAVTNASNNGNELATDMFGHLYVAGYFGQDTAVAGDSILINSSAGTALCLFKYDASGHAIWGRTASGYNTGNFNGNISVEPGGLCTDRVGNVYVTGSFEGSAAVFGRDTLINPDPIQAVVFLVKYDSSGDVLWARTASVSSGSSANSVSADALGNVYITGYFVTSFSLGTTTFHTVGADVFTAKYDNNGHTVWVRCANYINGSYITGNSICADSIGNSYITGLFQTDSVVFGSITLYNPSPYGARNTFTIKYDTAGNVIWGHAPTGLNSTNTVSASIVSTPSGDSYITGYFDGRYIIFGHDTLINNINSQDDIFIVKYNSVGKVIWARTVERGNTGNLEGIGLAIDQTGDLNVLCSMSEENVLIFGSDTIDLGTTGGVGNYPLFVAKYDSSGAMIWVQVAGLSISPGMGTRAKSIAMSSDDGIYVSGIYESSTISFGNLPITCPSGETSIFLAKLDTSSATSGIVSRDIPSNIVSVYPNPSSGIYTITGAADGAVLTISDAIGREVYVMELGGKINQVNLSKAVSGIYFFKFISGSINTTQKVVLNSGR